MINRGQPAGVRASTPTVTRPTPDPLTKGRDPQWVKAKGVGLNNINIRINDLVNIHSVNTTCKYHHLSRGSLSPSLGLSIQWLTVTVACPVAHRHHRHLSRGLSLSLSSVPVAALAAREHCCCCLSVPWLVVVVVACPMVHCRCRQSLGQHWLPGNIVVICLSRGLSSSSLSLSSVPWLVTIVVACPMVRRCRCCLPCGSSMPSSLVLWIDVVVALCPVACHCRFPLWVVVPIAVICVCNSAVVIIVVLVVVGVGIVIWWVMALSSSSCWWWLALASSSGG